MEAPCSRFHKALLPRLDLNRKVYSLGVHIPMIRVDADYTIEGNILLLPLVGDGAARLHLRKTHHRGERRRVV